MFCPECRVEYREGSTVCVDCQVPLLEGTPPPELESAFDPNLELVVVLETCDRFALALAKGLLGDAGIPFFVLNELSMLVTDVDPMLRKWVRVQVASDREAEARELLARISQPEPDGVGMDET